MTSKADLQAKYKPKRILLFCGKRKTGKDFLTDRLHSLLPDPPPSVIVHLSGPLKKCYADDHGLDYEELMGASEYKEKHRLAMIQWSEELRNRDGGYFCRAALEMYEAEKFPIWIVSDCRRKTDFAFFEEVFPDVCRRVRVIATEETRKQRGFVFQEGVDNAESECGLDSVTDFHHMIENDGDKPAEDVLAPILADVKLVATL